MLLRQLRAGVEIGVNIRRQKKRVGLFNHSPITTSFQLHLISTLFNILVSETGAVPSIEYDKILFTYCAGILEQSMGAWNRVPVRHRAT